MRIAATGKYYNGLRPAIHDYSKYSPRSAHEFCVIWTNILSILDDYRALDELLRLKGESQCLE